MPGGGGETVLPNSDPPATRRGQEHEKGLPRRPNMNQEVFTLVEGDATLQWPSEMSAESFADFKDWLDLIRRKAERAVTPR